MTVVIVEDNDNLRESVAGYLELEGYRVLGYNDLPEAAEILDEKPDCVILDVMLPGGNGFLLGKTIRESSQVPLIFLTARISESDRITGLELGADDYVTKPFSPREMVLRVNALIRRWNKSGECEDDDETGTASLGDSAPATQSASGKSPESRSYQHEGHNLEISPGDHRISVEEQAIKLTAAEWNIIEFISRRPGQLFSRMQLLEHCLDSMAEGSERTVDTHIKNLRQKLGHSGWIETERGFGYRFSGTPD